MKQRLKAFLTLLLHFLSLITLSTIYYINRVAIGFIPWMETTKWILWYYPMEDDVETDHEKQEAREYAKLRAKATIFVIFLIIITLIYVFTPIAWVWSALTIIAICLTISATIALIYVRRKRRKRDKELLTND